MMNNNFASDIHFNHKNRTIEITKKFDKASSRFGTDEFKALQEAVAFAPQYKVVVKNRKANDSLKGLTYNFMEKYIKNHDADGSIWNEYMEYRGYMTEDGETVLAGDAMSYGDIKVWFLEKYPVFEEFNNSRKKRIADLKETRRARREEANVA